MAGVLGGVLTQSPSTSAAQEPAAEPQENAVRYDRKSGKVQTKNTLDTKFKQAKAQQDKAEQRKVEMMSADDFARQRAAVAREVADKQIEMMKRLIKATESSDGEYPDLLFRLSDHYLEKKAYFDMQAGALYEGIYAAEEQGKKGEAKQLEEKQKRFQNESKAASEDAVKIYKALVSNPGWGKYKRMDEALYFYAFELGQLGREAEMKEAYLRLIREYPQSPYIANAYLSFADFYYARNKIPDALKLYDKIVTAYKDSPVYAYALYKMGWCYLNPIAEDGSAEYDKSLQKFVQTIQATLEGRAGSEGNAKQLRRDSRRDLVKAYVHAGKPSKAWEFFTKVGNGPKKEEDMARKMMELLAINYFGEGMYVESTSVYKTLQEQYPADETVCEWQGRIVVNALATDNKEIQWKETERLGEYFEQFEKGNFAKAAKRKCHDEALDTTKQMATVWHDEAEKTRRPETYDLAEKAYGAFLRFFPTDKDAYEMQYYYAELVWAQAQNAYNSKDPKEKQRGLEKFREARQRFIDVLEKKPDGKYSQTAAYAQMLAMKNALEYDETGGQAKGCKTNSEGVCVYKEKAKKKTTKASAEGLIDVEGEYPKSDFTDTEKQMLEAYDIYQKYVKDPKDKELPKILWHRAALRMNHNRFEEAEPLLISLVEKFDGTIYAAWSAEALVDMLTIRWLDSRNTPEDTIKASDTLETWSKKIQTTKTWKHEEADRVREAVPTLLAGIGWKRGLAYQEAGQYVECGQEFVELYNQYESHDRADQLLFNAARCFEAGYLVGQAIKLRNILLEKYPESSTYQQTLLEVAQNYQRIAYYDKSAERFEQYAGKYPRDKDTPDALQNAYLFRLGMGDEAKAKEDITKYEDLYKKKDPKTAAKIFWSKYDLLDNDAARLAHAREFLSIYGGRGGSDRQIVAEAAIGQTLWRQSCAAGLLYDSCMTIKRSKATAGEGDRQKAAKLRRQTKKKDSKKVDIPQYCGNPTQGIITVHQRDKKKAAEAQSHLSTVLKLAKKAVDIPADEPERAEAYKNAIGMAQVYAADKDYEEYLTIEMPEGLDFVVEDYKKDSGMPKWEKEYKEQVKRRDESNKRVKEFFDRKKKLADKLAGDYAEVLKTKTPYWVLAAAARSAVVYQNFADQLYRAEVPRNFKVEDQYFAYCDTLADFAEPLQKQALEAFTYCLQRSTEFQFFNTFSRMCEEELQQRDPDKFPATNELFGQSVYTDSQMDVVQVQTDLTGDSKTNKKKPPKDQKPKAAESSEDEPAEDDTATEAGV